MMDRLLAAGLALLRKAAPLLITLLIAAFVFAICLAALDGHNRQKAAVEGVRAKGAAVLSEAGDKASTAALEAVAAQGERELQRNDLGQENRDAILAAPDAGATAGAAGDAGLVGMCRRAIYRDHPRCVGLRGPHPAPAPR